MSCASQGRLQTSGKETQRLTYHDPCQVSRRGGVVQQPRNLLNRSQRTSSRCRKPAP